MTDLQTCSSGKKSQPTYHKQTKTNNKQQINRESNAFEKASIWALENDKIRKMITFNYLLNIYTST